MPFAPSLWVLAGRVCDGEGGRGDGWREEGKPLPPLLTPGGTTLSAPDAQWLSTLFSSTNIWLQPKGKHEKANHKNVPFLSLKLSIKHSFTVLDSSR